MAENVTIEFNGWNVGSCKAYKCGTGISIIIPKNIIEEQGIEAGHTVEIFLKKTSIPKKVRKHFIKRWDPNVPFSSGGDVLETHIPEKDPPGKFLEMQKEV